MHKLPDNDKTGISAHNVLFDELCQQVRDAPLCQGISQLDVVSLPTPVATVINTILRYGAITQTNLANELALSPQQVTCLTRLLAEKGYLKLAKDANTDEVCYRVQFSRRTKRKSSTRIWDKLDY